MKRITQAHLPVIAQSHPGMKGKNNEDRYAVSAFQISDTDATPVLVTVLCDGIGGHRAGEVAAEMAVNRISQGIADSDGSQPLETLRAAVGAASDEIYATAQADGNRRGMGATLACVWIIDRSLYTVTVGDSRIYLLRDENIQQLSTDHTWIQDALDAGLLQPDQVKGHPNAHVIRRYLGSPAAPQLDFRLRLNSLEDNTQMEANQGMLLRPGDQLLLCSDGLSDLVEPNEILSELQKHPIKEAGERLVALANQRGGFDNITLVIVAVPSEHKKKPPLRKWVVGCLGLLAILMLGAALVAGFFWLRAENQGSRTPQPGIIHTLPPLVTTPSATLPAGKNIPPLQLTPTASPPALPASKGPTLTAWPTASPNP